jgi:hypothetical protein
MMRVFASLLTLSGVLLVAYGVHLENALLISGGSLTLGFATNATIDAKSE